MTLIKCHECGKKIQSKLQLIHNAESQSKLLIILHNIVYFAESWVGKEGLIMTRIADLYELKIADFYISKIKQIT